MMQPIMIKNQAGSADDDEIDSEQAAAAAAVENATAVAADLQKSEVGASASPRPNGEQYETLSRASSKGDLISNASDADGEAASPVLEEEPKAGNVRQDDHPGTSK